MPDGVSTGRYTSSSLPWGRSYRFSGFDKIAHLGFDRPRCRARLARRRRGCTARRRGAARRSRGSCRLRSRASRARANRRAHRAARRASTAPIAAGDPVRRPSVSAGATRPCALMTVVVRAFAIASRSPTRRLAIAVASPTIRSAITPASANRPTSNATKRRLDSSVLRDRVMCGERRGGSRARREGRSGEGGIARIGPQRGVVSRRRRVRHMSLRWPRSSRSLRTSRSRRGWSRGRRPRRNHSARRSWQSAGARSRRCR